MRKSSRRRLSAGYARLVKGKCPKPKSDSKKYVRRRVCASKIADAETLHGRYRQVWEGRADRTRSGMRKSDLVEQKGRRDSRGKPLIVSKKKQQRGKQSDLPDEWDEYKFKRRRVSKQEFMQLAMIETKKGGIKYKYWTDDDGDKFTIVQQRPLTIKFTLLQGKPADLVNSFAKENYGDQRQFTAPVTKKDMEKVKLSLSGGKKLSAKDCKEKNGYPTRPMQVCVLVNKKRKKSKCKDHKVRRDGGRCSPSRRTPCKKPGQVRRKNKSGKYVCADPRKGRKSKKTIKDRVEACREKGKVYDRKTKRCRESRAGKKSKKPKKKSKK